MNADEALDMLRGCITRVLDGEIIVGRTSEEDADEAFGVLVDALAERDRETDPDYSPAYQDEYQRLWHRDEGRARVYLLALEAIDATRIPSDGQKDAAERAYFDVKSVTAAALRPSETPLVALDGVPAAVEVQEAMLAHERHVAEFEDALAVPGAAKQQPAPQEEGR